MKPTTQSTSAIQPAERVCPRCGTVLGGFGPEGLCPSCLLLSGLEEELASESTAASVFQPRRFGEYELLEEVARGGMGVIYKARQVKLNRIVAVKMILGGQHAGVAELARFRAEAETAAQLQHPNIVAIHEVGESEGQPFFSMDFVEGQNLAQLVGNTPLPSQRAAKYLQAITEAVHYAHQQGVLHRDLKPSNVLVDSVTDQPRVTDFGLAKRMEEDANLTLTGQVLGSPGFMPPEQAAGKQDEISPASDVYSLGAILYHLLTGRAPFVADTVTATLRMVAESEPISPRLLNASVPRDLETICLKCLQKESVRRYASARELANDLGHYLSDEPILARPASGMEKVWRWCQRKPALASAVVLVVIVIVGSPIAVVLVNRARLRAQTEAVKSAQVAKFLKDMLESVSPSVAQGRDVTLMREILDKTAVRAQVDLANEPLVQAEILGLIGEVYEALGEGIKAEGLQRAALSIYQESDEAESPAVAELLLQMCYSLWRQNRREEAETFGVRALALHRKIYGSKHTKTAQALLQLGNVYWRSDKIEEARAVTLEALNIERNLAGTNNTSGLAYAYGQAGVIEYRADNHKTAEPLLRASVDIYERLGDNFEVVWRMEHLAQTLAKMDRSPEAESVLQRAVEIEKKTANHDALSFSLRTLARVLSGAGKSTEAEAVMRENLSTLEQIYRGVHINTSVVQTDLADLLTARGDTTEAEKLYRSALLNTQNRYGNSSSYFAAAMYNLAQFLLFNQRSDEARPVAEIAVDVYYEINPSGWQYFEARGLFGIILLAEKRYAEAEPHLHSARVHAAQRNDIISSESRKRLKSVEAALEQLRKETARKPAPVSVLLPQN